MIRYFSMVRMVRFKLHLAHLYAFRAKKKVRCDAKTPVPDVIGRSNDVLRERWGICSGDFMGLYLSETS